MIDIDESIIKGTCDLHQGLVKRTIAMEECSELIQAISKCTRDEYFDRASSEPTDEHYENEVEEIADVLISIKMIQYLDGIPDGYIQEWIDKKQKRQMVRDYQTYRDKCNGDKQLYFQLEHGHDDTIANREYAIKCMGAYDDNKRNED